MVGAGLERNYLLFPAINKLNLYLNGGVDLGLGLGAKVSVKGTVEESYIEDWNTSRTTINIDEQGTGTNGFYYGGHIGAGPQYSIKNITVYSSFNLFLAQLRKVNTATYDVLNSGFIIGAKF